MKNKNKQIISDVKKYLGETRNESKVYKEIETEKDKNYETNKDKSFEEIVRSEVKKWIQENGEQYSNNVIEKVLKEFLKN